jgi:ectoine hydroxylase-related dioxygenase (phytanoyl-CoA dioxygenase family)
MSEVLTQDQIDFYNKKGYLIVENQIPDDVIANIRTEITRFEEEARGLTVSNDRLMLRVI